MKWQGGGGGGESADRCARGGRIAQPNRDNQTRAQIQWANRLGPEGLGNKNDIEDPWENGEGMDLGLGDSSAGGHVQGPPSQEPVPVPEKPVLSNQAVNIISALAAVARDCILESADCGVVMSTSLWTPSGRLLNLRKSFHMFQVCYCQLWLNTARSRKCLRLVPILIIGSVFLHLLVR